MFNLRTLGLFGICLISLGVSRCSTEGSVLQPVSADSDDSLEVSGAAEKHGSRLKVLYKRWTATDGVRVSVPGNHFLDTKLGTECGFYPAEDGVSRCLPILKGDQVDSAKYFLDSACTQQVTVFMKCQPKPEYASEQVPGPMPCGSFPFRVHKLGSAITPPALYQKSFAVCTAVAAGTLASILSNGDVYPLTTLAPTEFVQGDWKYVQTP